MAWSPEKEERFDRLLELLEGQLEEQARRMAAPPPLPFTTVPIARSCGACDYFAPSAGGLGECRRRPPIVALDLPGWPVLHSSSWCGEFFPLQVGRLVAERPVKRI